ncbi:MAG: hypothetical protein FWF53_12275 [Candidatus Azobacteroides sp.]|nr:hypothetical protein [Candidatus Azobacteroides sp.]
MKNNSAFFVEAKNSNYLCRIMEMQMKLKFNKKCAHPIHPGEVLKDEIEYCGMSQSKLAAQMGMSYNQIF